MGVVAVGVVVVAVGVVVFVTLYITVANMAVPSENINSPLDSVCCDGDSVITLLYESIARRTMITNGFVILGVCVYINPGVLYLYRVPDAFFEQFGHFGL